MKKPKKKNPQRQLRESDIKRIKNELVEEAIRCSYVVMLNVLRDNEGYGPKRLKRVYDGIDDLTDSISKGYVSFYDLEKVLYEEAGIVISIGGKGRYVGKNEQI